MKKILFNFFSLIIFANSSYASFPVSDALKLNQNTLQREEIKHYRFSLIKMGIDLKDCRYESHKADIPISAELINQNVKIPVDYHKYIFKFFLITGFVGLIMALYGILSTSWSDIGIGIFGGFLFIASLVVLLLNFLIKKIKQISKKYY